MTGGWSDTAVPRGRWISSGKTYKWERCFSEEKFQVSGCSLSSASHEKVPEEAVPVPEYVD